MHFVLKISLSWIFVMSPRFGTSGQWYARTAFGNGSISESQAAFHPKGSHATEAASMPLQTLPNTNPMLGKYLFSWMARSLLLRINRAKRI